jgi:hypothetical protein
MSSLSTAVLAVWMSLTIAATLLSQVAAATCWLIGAARSTPTATESTLRTIVLRICVSPRLTTSRRSRSICS